QRRASHALANSCGRVVNGATALLCMPASVAYRAPPCRRTPGDAVLENTCTRRTRDTRWGVASDSAICRASPTGCDTHGVTPACGASHAQLVHCCRSKPTATARRRLQYWSSRMKSESLSMAAMRASRLLSCAALAASLAVLLAGGHGATGDAVLAGLMTPLSASCIALLALAALLVSFPRRWMRAVGQCVAACACLLALAPSLAGAVIALFAQLPSSPLDTFLQSLPDSGLPAATSIMLIATALALLLAPGRGQLT